MEPFRQKGSSMASWSTFIFKNVIKNYDPKQTTVPKLQYMKATNINKESTTTIKEGNKLKIKLVCGSQWALLICALNPNVKSNLITPKHLFKPLHGVNVVNISWMLRIIIKVQPPSLRQRQSS